MKSKLWLFVPMLVVCNLEAAELDAAKFIDRALADCGIQKAIDTAASQGGGIVKVPEGTFALRRGLVLKDGVQLVGAGMDKTILTPARKALRMDVVSSSVPATNQLKTVVQQLPESLEVGMGLMMCGVFPPAHIVHTRPAAVVSVDRETKSITMDTPYGVYLGNHGVLTAGLQFVLKKSVAKGDKEISLENTGGIKVGDELTLGTPGNESMLSHVFVKEIKGSTVLLEAPAAIDFPLWPERAKFGNDFAHPLVWAVFPMIHSAHVKDAAIRDLTVKGPGLTEVYPLCMNYTVAGIHLFDSKRVTIERTAVREWHADGISLQVAEGDRVLACEVTGCLGNGFHPGTGTADMLFENNLSTGNGAGLYFCWSNTKNHLIHNKFVKNRGGGITGLGNPHDQNNLIENNLIAENGGPGIEINGGLKSGNVIQNNTIENNSQNKPGKSPGIAVYAATEDALDYSIFGNTIRDTQATPTQFVGIEEKNGEYGKKPTRADENAIRDNKFTGLKLADIVLAGNKTTVQNVGAKVIKASELAEIVKAAK